MQRSSKIQQSSVNITQIEACRICRNLDVDKFEDDDYRPSGSLRLERRLDEIKRTSKSGCQFCRVIVESIEYFSGDGDLSDSKHVIIRFLNGTIDFLFTGDFGYRLIEIYSPRG